MTNSPRVLPSTDALSDAVIDAIITKLEKQLENAQTKVSDIKLHIAALKG